MLEELSETVSICGGKGIIKTLHQYLSVTRTWLALFPVYLAGFDSVGFLTDKLGSTNVYTSATDLLCRVE